MQKRSVTVALLSAICAGLFFTGMQAASATTADDAAAFVRKINAERSSRGLHTLVVRSDLASVARAHSRAMAADGYIYHSTNLPSQVSGNWTLLGENVGEGPDVASLHTAFMESPSHRKNVLEPGFNQVGIGVVRAADGTMYVTEVFATRGSTTTTHTVTHKRPALRKVAVRRKTSSVAHRPAPAPKAAPPVGTSAQETIVALQRMAGLDGA